MEKIALHRHLGERTLTAAAIYRQARSVECKRQWALRLKGAILESYGVEIPKHARELVMKLGQHRENGETLNGERGTGSGWSSADRGKEARLPKKAEANVNIVHSMLNIYICYARLY